VRDNQVFNENVLLAADTTVTSTTGDVTFEQFVDAADNAVAGSDHGLTVNTPAGNNRFQQQVGGNNVPGVNPSADPHGLEYLRTDQAGAFGETQLAIPGAPAVAVLTTLDQNYGDAVKLEVNTVLESTGNGAIRFGRPVTSPGTPYELTVNTGGDTTFGAGAGTGTDPLAVINTDGSGRTILGGGVTVRDNQVFNENVLLAADTTVTSTTGDVTFDQTLTSPGAGNEYTLAVNAAGATSFNGAVGGAVGGNDALGSLTTDEPGTTAINGGSVTTTGAQTYRDPVAIGGNAVLNAGSDVQLDGDVSGPGNALTVNAGNDVVIGGDIGSDSDRLTEVKLNSGSDGDIKFNGDSAQGVYASNLIQLNTNRGSPPQDATIYKILGNQAPPGPDTGNTLLTLDAGAGGNFVMDANDKLSVPNGELLIMAKNATVADLNALVVQVGEPEGTGNGPVDKITVLYRARGYVTLPDGTPFFDSGRDVNGNQVLWYFDDLDNQATSPTTSFTIGTRTGGEVSQDIADRRTTDSILLRAIFEDLGALETADFFNVNDDNVLDIVSRGPGDIANLDFIPYVPQEEEKNPSAVSNRAAVSQIPLRPDELLAWFDCVEAEKGFECEEEIVGAERAASADAEKIRALAADLFGETQEQRDRRLLQGAVDAYRARTGARRVDGAEFRRFVETSPQHKEALGVLDRYAEMLSSIREFGVTDEAYDVLKSTKLEQIAPEGLGADALGDAVEAGITAWPRDPGVRAVAASDRMYLFRGRDTGRAYLLEEAPPTTDVTPAP
jgi:hypothetical protein